MELGAKGALADNARANRQLRAEHVHLLRQRLELLDGLDRTLMTMHLENGATFRQMAQLAGVSEAAVSRRIRRLSERLCDERVLLMLRYRNRFTPQERTLVGDHFLAGRSMRRIARQRGCTYYQVRRTLQRLQRLTDTISRAKAS